MIYSVINCIRDHDTMAIFQGIMTLFTYDLIGGFQSICLFMHLDVCYNE